MPIFLTTSTNWHVVKLPTTKYFNHASKGPVQLMRFTMVLSAQFSANKKKKKKKENAPKDAKRFSLMSCHLFETDGNILIEVIERHR